MAATPNFIKLRIVRSIGRARLGEDVSNRHMGADFDRFTRTVLCEHEQSWEFLVQRGIAVIGMTIRTWTLMVRSFPSQYILFRSGFPKSGLAIFASGSECETGPEKPLKTLTPWGCSDGGSPAAARISRRLARVMFP